MATLSYSKFKSELFSKLTLDEKNLLFYWSLIDSSGWEEVPPNFFPDTENGHKTVIKVLEKSPQIKKFIKKDPKKFVDRFIMGEFLANYLLASELELKLDSSWVLDIENIQRTDFPDIKFDRRKIRAYIEIKGVLSASNLRDRVSDEVMPSLKPSDNCLLLLLFPVCPKESPARINQLVEGYYIYENILKKGRKERKVICQCFTDNEKERDDSSTLDNLVGRILRSYFEILDKT